MSASFFWEPVQNRFEFMTGTSSDAEVLRNTFGDFPITFTQSQIDILTAMHRAKGATQSIYGEIAAVLAANDIDGIVVTVGY